MMDSPHMNRKETGFIDCLPLQAAPRARIHADNWAFLIHINIVSPITFRIAKRP
jgi:hypothetical protein